ncbi:MAG TPA: hypothetical protein VMU50_01195 [Polyangia bacterium]|nr:hypothetical protein [Polyangia bacterium]
MAALVGIWTALVPRAAEAQACCAATALISPARLQGAEQLGMGVRLRSRSVLGSFDSAGRYAPSPPGDLDVAEDLFAAVRVGVSGQVAFFLPIVQSRRTIPGYFSWGGGVGDLNLSGRYTWLLPGEHPIWPGITWQIGVSIPTGRSVSEASDSLAADATGTGTFEGTVGVNLQQIAGSWFVSFDGWIAQRVPRNEGGVQQSFSPRWTGVLSGGYVLGNHISAGLFLNGQTQGSSRTATDGKIIDGSAQSLVTAGGGAIVPIADVWRLAATLSLDVLISGFGRNQLGGAALSVSVCRLWI